MHIPYYSRRSVIASMAAMAGSLVAPTFAFGANPILKRKIPSTGEAIPTIGMGTWITFNVGNDKKARLARTEVLRTFFAMGGGMVDSSPMYGSSEDVVGFCLKQMNYPDKLFSATKVWTPLAFYGKRQIKNSHKLWGINKFDLLQVHNLVNLDAHLETLFQMKAEKKLRYVGVTTSH